MMAPAGMVAMKFLGPLPTSTDAGSCSALSLPAALGLLVLLVRVQEVSVRQLPSCAATHAA